MRYILNPAAHIAWILSAALAIGTAATAAELTFRTQELETKLGVGYAVRLVDMNDDGRLDIVVVDRERILWLENPDWNEHSIIEGQTAKDNVCIAPEDIDGDGKLDFAVGAGWSLNTNGGGTIQWIRASGDPDALWSVQRIGEEPTVHRMRFADLDDDGKKELIVVPLLGRGTTRPHFQEQGVRILAFQIPANPMQGPWPVEVISDQLHVTHNFWPTDLDQDGQMDVVVTSFEGITLLTRTPQGPWHHTLLGTGNQVSAPNRGASEVKRGRLAGGKDYLATIEPWHGNQVVVYTRPAEPRPDTGPWPWPRAVLDDQLKWGHAVCCTNLDDDADEELIIGVRDDLSPSARRGVRVYDPGGNGRSDWHRTVVDPGGVAVEDLAAADLNGDGRIDIVAVGRQTHNVKIYWNE